MGVYEMAKKYYPRLWDTHRLELLVQAGRLTQAEADEIMGVPNLGPGEEVPADEP